MKVLNEHFCTYNKIRINTIIGIKFDVVEIRVIWQTRYGYKYMRSVFSCRNVHPFRVRFSYLQGRLCPNFYKNPRSTCESLDPFRSIYNRILLLILLLFY